MRAKLVRESIADDMREPHVEVKPYPEMSVEDFNEWISKLGEYFYDAPHELIMDQMVNNEVSTDEELSEYLIDAGADPRFIEELIPMRPYFWDFRYSQHINI